MMKQTMLEALPVFLSRQHLVHQAMKELRPDLLLLASDVREEERREQHLKARELFAKHSHVPQLGSWEAEGDEWEYFIHGAGCRLINKNTGEPLEWSAPNLDAFHAQWFINWVKWHLNQIDEQEDVEDETLMEIFINLVADGSVVEVKLRSGIEFRADL